MTAFALGRILAQDQSDDGFDAHLRSKLLGGPTPPPPHCDAVDVTHSDDADVAAVRGMFRTAAAALQLELAHRDRDLAPSPAHSDGPPCHCHWIPGRIEVMGKHTDYAGGNSLVCATSGRGMAMASTFVPSDGDGDAEMKVTVASFLPEGMEHHAARTAAPYRVEGRVAVHHTIHIGDGETTDDEGTLDATPADWTIYPTAVVRRLAQNFGLHPHLDGADASSNGGTGGGHVFIAISSNLPPASGLSTSSALVTGLFLALDSHLHLSNTVTYRRAIGEPDSDDTIYNLSTYLGNVENGRDYINGDCILKGTVQGGVGTFGGSEDHAAILMGRRGELRLLSFCPTRPCSFHADATVGCDGVIAPETIERSIVRLPSELTFVIAYSGARAEKAGDASVGYNAASDLARKAFDAYFVGGGSEGLERSGTLADAIRRERQRLDADGNADDQSVKAIITKRIESGALATDQSPTSLVERFDQFYDESERLVPSVARAISNGEYEALGPLVDASHRGAVNGLRNQIEETAWLPLWARGHEHMFHRDPLSVGDGSLGCSMDALNTAKQSTQRITALAASAFGAGFGGSCWALVHRDEAQEFLRQWVIAYDERFAADDNGSGRTREFFCVDPGPGAFCV